MCALLSNTVPQVSHTGNTPFSDVSHRDPSGSPVTEATHGRAEDRSPRSTRWPPPGPSSPRRCGRSLRHAKPGRTTTDLDKIAADVLARHGATSPFLNYHPRWAPSPFPAVLCVSVNDAVVHGIPTDYALADGDLVSVDFGATLRGWTGDAARSFIVGTPRAEDAALIAATDAALAAGIAAVRPGNTLGDVGHAIGSSARGRATACSPTTAATASAAPCTRTRTCPTRARPDKGMRLRPGLVIAIEPMLIADGTDEYLARPRRVDVAHRVGRPRRPQRAHRRRHRRRRPHPDHLTTDGSLFAGPTSSRSPPPRSSCCRRSPPRTPPRSIRSP